MTHSNIQADSSGNQPPRGERLIALLGALLIVGTVGILLYYAVAGSRSPPAISVQPQAIIDQKEGYLLQFRAFNQGDQTAGEVKIIGHLRSDNHEETSEATLDYVPPQSERSGGLFFRQDPRQGELVIRVTGYQKP
jgi:uncharacterized protein (TIGR02588 family)